MVDSYDYNTGSFPFKRSGGEGGSGWGCGQPQIIA